MTLASNEGGRSMATVPRSPAPRMMLPLGAMSEVDGVEFLGGERGLQLKGLQVRRVDARSPAVVLP